MALAWLVSLNVVWSASANAIAGAVGAPLSPGGRQRPPATCDRAADFAALAALPATTVLAISNLGAPILAIRHHRVLAGPYHRNVAGNLLALRGLHGERCRGRARSSRTNGVGLVVLCRGNDETGALAQWAPAGFIAALAARRGAGMAGKTARHRWRTARNLSRPQAVLTAHAALLYVKQSTGCFLHASL